MKVKTKGNVSGPVRSAERREKPVRRYKCGAEEKEKLCERGGNSEKRGEQFY